MNKKWAILYISFVAFVYVGLIGCVAYRMFDTKPTQLDRIETRLKSIERDMIWVRFNTGFNTDNR